MTAIGICRRDVPCALPTDLQSVVQAAAASGFGAVAVASLLDISAELSAGELDEAHAWARDAGIELWAGGGMLNAHHLERAPDLVGQDGDRDPIEGLERLLVALEILGQKELTVVIGAESDRADVERPWRAQLEATAVLLARMAPVLRDRGARLLVKTHEEITTAEVVELVERVGADVLGIAFDPVNVVVRGELPVAAAARVRPYMAAVHVDDAWVCTAPEGLVRRSSPLGAGCLPWSALVWGASDGPVEERPRLLVDLHRAQLATPYLRPDWQALQSLDPAELDGLRQQAVPDREAVRDIPSRFDAAVEALTRWNLLPSPAFADATETDSQ